VKIFRILAFLPVVAATAAPDDLGREAVIQYGWQRHEAELSGYRPDFQPGWPMFDARNLPVIKAGSENEVGLPPLQQLGEDGRWRDWNYDAALPGKAGQWANLSLFPAVFDADGDAYLLVDATGDKGGSWVLLHARAGSQKWTAHALPYGKMRGDYKGRIEDGNLAIMQVPDSAEPLAHPPVILGTDGEALSFVAPEKTADGSLVIPSPQKIASVAGDLDVKFDASWKAGWGGWGHGEPQRVATHGPWIFFVWARPTPVPPHPGTPMFIAAWNRETKSLAGPLYLGSSGREVDSHNMPVVVTDSRGFVHVVLGAHGTIENPLETCLYMRSKKPLDITAGFGEPEPFPIPGTTYPGAVVGPDDALHILVRRYEQYAVVREDTFARGFVLKTRDPKHDTAAFPVYPPSQLVYLRKDKDGWSHQPLVRSYFGSYVFWHNRLSIDRRGNLYAAYRYSPRSDFLERPVPAALLTSRDGGNKWHLAGTADFLIGAGLPVPDTVPMPIRLGEESGKTSLGEPGFGYKPNAIFFDPAGHAWIPLWPSSDKAPAFQILRDGAWKTVSTDSALPEDFKPGPWMRMNRHFPVFDSRGRSYVLADGTGSPGGAWYLIVSADGGETWTAHRTPLGALPGGFKDLPDANANFPRLVDPDGDQPPAILANDGENLLLFDVRLDDKGTPNFQNAVKLADSAARHSDNVPTRSHAGWGGFGHDNGSRAVAIGDKIHVVFALPRPVEGFAGTPSYAVTYDRTDGKVTGPVFLGTSGIEIDGHNMPAIVADSKGYLHVVLGAHGGRQGQSFIYLKSAKPDDTTAWETPVAMEKGTTYPILLCDKRDVLHVISRGPDGTLVHDRKPQGGAWETRRELVRPFHDGRYALYYQDLAESPDGRLFLHFRAMNRTTGRASPDSDQKDYDPVLLVSDDGGEDWKAATTELFGNSSPGTTETRP